MFYPNNKGNLSFCQWVYTKQILLTIIVAHLIAGLFKYY